MDEENQPRNILEEIVWYKAKEIEVWRDKLPLAALSVSWAGAPMLRSHALRYSNSLAGKQEISHGAALSHMPLHLQ